MLGIGTCHASAAKRAVITVDSLSTFAGCLASPQSTWLACHTALIQGHVSSSYLAVLTCWLRPCMAASKRRLMSRCSTTCWAQEEHSAASSFLPMAIKRWNLLGVLEEVSTLHVSISANELHEVPCVMLARQLWPRSNTTPHWYDNMKCISYPKVRGNSSNGLFISFSRSFSRKMLLPSDKFQFLEKKPAPHVLQACGANDKVSWGPRQSPWDCTSSRVVFAPLTVKIIMCKKTWVAAVLVSLAVGTKHVKTSHICKMYVFLSA